MECAEVLCGACNILKSSSTFCLDAFMQELDMLHPGFCWALLQATDVLMEALRVHQGLAST